MSKPKKKKEKVIYYDDGSTISDMSRVNRTGQPRQPKPQQAPSSLRPVDPRNASKSKWKTYWSAVRMMLLPMFVVLGVLALLFLIMLGVGQCAS